MAIAVYLMDAMFSICLGLTESRRPQETRQSFRLFQSCLQFDGEVRGNGRGDGIPSPKFGTVV